MATKKPISIPIPAEEEAMVTRIYDSISKQNEKNQRLSRLGASSIGGECLKKIWLSWRGYDNPKPSGRIYRLFETGHLQERRIINDLRQAGYSVWDESEPDVQYEYSDESGHFICKIDGVIKGVQGAEETPHVLEIKTHNTKSFAELEKKGVANSQLSHYYQVQAGMLFSGFKRGLYVALNKDTEQYYIKRIKPDFDVQNDILARIEKLIESDISPVGIGEDPEKYPCTWCDYKDVCFNKKAPLINCRSCEHSKPFENGTWLCTLKNTTLTLKEQSAACESYSQKGR